MGVFADLMARLLAEDRRRRVEQMRLADAATLARSTTFGGAIEASFRVVEDRDCPPGELRAIGPGPDGKPAILGKIVNIGGGEG